MYPWKLFLDVGKIENSVTCIILNIVVVEKKKCPFLIQTNKMKMVTIFYILMLHFDHMAHVAVKYLACKAHIVKTMLQSTQ